MSIYDMIASAGGAGLILLTLIQIAPIKINPWSKMMKAIGKAMNAEVLAKVNNVESDLQSLRGDVDNLRSEEGKGRALDCRARIVRFGDEIQCGEKHSKEHFNAILYDISMYEKYCKENPGFPNEVAVINIELIKDIYKKCLEKRNFL